MKSKRCPTCGKIVVEPNPKHPLAKGLVLMKVFDEPQNRYCTCDPIDMVKAKWSQYELDPDVCGKPYEEVHVEDKDGP